MKLISNLKKSIVTLFVLLFFLCHSSFVFAITEKPDLISQSAILMDNKTNKILYGKNENEKMYPASTTKIVTAILALENCNLEDIITVSYDAVMSIPDGYSSASLQIGEQLTVEQLLDLLLVHSANDAANVLAEYIGGSVESFISMMNTKINELGLSNTHFTNAFGMHDDSHYTTAQDLALIMQYCIRNENFRRIAGKASCAIPATNKYGVRRYNSTNELILPNSSNYYAPLTCGKTGYTSQAGDCLVSCSYQNDLELICVVLGGKTVNGISTRFSETKILFNYGYDNYAIRTLLNSNNIVTNVEIKNGTKDTKNLDLLANDNVSALMETSTAVDTLEATIVLNDNIKAPIEQGDILGSVSYTVGNIKYETELIASHSVEKSKLLQYLIEIGIGVLILILIYSKLPNKKKKKVYRVKNFK